MKKLIGINFLFLSLGLCVLNAEKAASAVFDDAFSARQLEDVIRYCRNDIQEKILKNSKLAEELKSDFQIAFQQYKDASEKLQFNVHGKVYEAFKPSYCDYQRFMFAVIFQLLQLGYNIDDINNPTNRCGEILLYYWLRANLLNDDECDKLYGTVRPGFYRCLCEVKRMRCGDGC